MIEGLYTFASPHVGNNYFVSMMRENVPQSWRMFHRTDFILQILQYVPIRFSPVQNGLVFLPPASVESDAASDNSTEPVSGDMNHGARIAFVEAEPGIANPISFKKGRWLPSTVRFLLFKFASLFMLYDKLTV